MPFTNKNASQASLKSWRTRRGIKIVVSIKPITKSTKQAIALFERKEYAGHGKSHSSALLDLFFKLREAVEERTCENCGNPTTASSRCEKCTPRKLD